MDEQRKNTLIMVLLIVLTIVSTLSAFMGYQALAVSRRAEQDRQALQALKAQVDRITLQLANFKGWMDKGGEHLARGPGFGPPMGPPGPMPGSIPPNSPPPPPGMRGPDGSSPGPTAVNLTPERVSSHRKDLLNRNAALHQADREKYGDQAGALFYASRFNPSGGGAGAEASEAAFSQLLTEYPEANATGMAIGERALESALKANTVAAEEYYKMLTANENFSSVVTDQGIEVMPALQGYLAYQYIQQGRFNEVETLLDSLESNYGDGLMAVPGQRGEAEWRPVSEVSRDLRSQLNNARQGS